MLHDDLSEKGLKNSTIELHFYNIEFFFDLYLKKCTILHPLEVSAADIEYYVGNWYLRKVLDAKPAKIMSILSNLKKFFKLMRAMNKIDEDQYQEIFEECKKSNKYRNRYTSYLAIDFDKEYGPNSWVEWVEGKETVKDD